MNQSGSYITKERKAELEAELTDLRGPKRKEIIDTLQYAKALGDLSENAEYHQAREEQGQLEERILQIEEILRVSEVVKHNSSDIVEVGSKVSVEKQDTKEIKNYVIVGSEESNIAEGKISNHSPLGAAMFGKKKGDTISFTTPKPGVVNYKIISVS